MLLQNDIAYYPFSIKGSYAEMLTHSEQYNRTPKAWSLKENV